MAWPIKRLGASLVLAAGLGLAAGCAFQMPPVPLEGSRTDLARLAGDWYGEYVSDTADDPGGTIMFRLRAGAEHAYGDVLMTRHGATRPFSRFDPASPRVLGLAPQSLSILLVRAADDVITGELDAYWDFERDCQALTLFRGRIVGNVVSGTYETTYRGPFANRTGKWRVTRTVTDDAAR